ncbi:class A beta-lactamase [Spirosoma validum]|uniref:beta-lactamase n=1 Tax=Spirosoma validum TaxID=2771355 RepID=A0A927B2G4_9BACT|nr:class A beta-lactamase [Spirosoma validum]MBD2754354.1 class A beta-lactamase [Spirosoma validum]
MIRYVLLLITLLLPASLYAQPSLPQSGTDKSVTNLRDQIEKIAQAAQGRVGVSATVIETGESVALRGDEQFPMQSVYKFPIGMTALHLVDQGKLSLTQTIHVKPAEYVSERQHSPLRDKNPHGADVTLDELLRYAVSESDGSASDVLMRLVGGPQVIMNYLKSFGVTGIIVANTEKEIGGDNAVQYRNWAKPNEIVELLKALQNGLGLSTSSRARLFRLMTNTQTGLKRLKGLLPAGTVVAHKTGTSWTIDGVTAATNDVGLITLPNGHHMAIAVFVSDAKADESTREGVIAKIAQAAWNTWNNP